MKKPYLALLVCSLFSSPLWAKDPLSVVASFSILGDVAHQIGDERVKVDSIVGPDSDTHAYHLRNADVRKIKAADVVLLNGLGLEPAELSRAAKQYAKVVFEATEGITPIKAEEEEHDHGHDHSHDHAHEHSHEHEGHHHHGEFDPHVWNDPVLMQTYAKNVANAFIKIDPEGKAYYEAKLADYQKTLQKLHEWAVKKFDAIPENARKVLTSHDAFSYMGKRYHIHFIAPEGVSTEAEPSALQVANIIRQVKKENIHAIFAENIKDNRQLERIAKETGASVKGKLYSDALSKGEPAATYVDLFRHNVNELSRAMQ